MLKPFIVASNTESTLMTILYIDDYMKKNLEKFRKSMADHFSYNGEVWEDIQTESNERLVLDALFYAYEYLEQQKKEVNQG